MTDRLSKLRKSLLDMTLEEQRSLVGRIRADRRITKERPSVKRTAARNKEKDKASIAKLLDGMTQEQIEALLGGSDVPSEGSSDN
jgi:uncharacterized protein YdaU (DUF1376 family)